MKRWTLDEIREALSALARDSGVDEIRLFVRADGRSEVRAGRAARGYSAERWGTAARRGGAWEAEDGDQDPIDRVLGRGEYQP